MVALKLTVDVCFVHRRVLHRVATAVGPSVDICPDCYRELRFVYDATDSIAGVHAPLNTHAPPRDLPMGVGGRPSP